MDQGTFALGPGIMSFVAAEGMLMLLLELSLPSKLSFAGKMPGFSRWLEPCVMMFLHCIH